MTASDADEKIPEEDHYISRLQGLFRVWLLSLQASCWETKRAWSKRNDRGYEPQRQINSINARESCLLLYYVSAIKLNNFCVSDHSSSQLWVCECQKQMFQMSSELRLRFKHPSGTKRIILQAIYLSSASWSEMQKKPIRVWLNEI